MRFVYNYGPLQFGWGHLTPVEAIGILAFRKLRTSEEPVAVHRQNHHW